MASRQLESQYYSRPHSSASEISRFQSLPQAPLTAAVGTGVQPRDLPKASSYDNGQKAKQNEERSSHFGRLLGGKSRAKQLIDKASIGQPMPLLPQPPPRPARPSIEQGPASFLTYPVVELSRPVLLNDGLPAKPTSPRIDPRHLGSVDEALHSHPTQGLLENLAGRCLPKSDKSIKSRHRKFVICERDDDEQIFLREPKPSPDLLTERRRGRVFSTVGTEGSLHQFPNPDTWKTNQEDQGAEKLIECGVPTIKLSPPEEGDVQQVEPNNLSVGHAYKILHHDAEREVRRLRRLKGLQPLAWLIAEAEGIDPNDTAALAEALRDIIEDRYKLNNLLPLAVTLCVDQGIEFDNKAFQELPQALEKILADRDRAQYVAGHHKRARQKLECRVKQLESELRLRDAGNESSLRHRSILHPHHISAHMTPKTRSKLHRLNRDIQATYILRPSSMTLHRSADASISKSPTMLSHREPINSRNENASELFILPDAESCDEISQFGITS
ncbi:hypothetical protein HD806DRAFT_522711 [Xylariaceae sp. AK1471]|nr:hypothetical protein HD806DRAFT_522711 [Xylariaceae sp. AK1471]